MYDQNNIFAKILRGDIPCQKVYEDTHVLAFHDLHPKAAAHILVIPKGAYCSLDDFSANATPEEIGTFFATVGQIARALNLHKEGYRILANHGTFAGQEVPHFHVHILGGNALGPLICPHVST